MAMTSRERVLTALRRQEPDRIPYCEFGIDRALAYKLMNWVEGKPQTQAANLETNPYTVEEFKEIAAFLKLDNIFYVLRPPVYAHQGVGLDGRLFYGDGMIKTKADLSLLQLPDACDPSLYAEAEVFAKNKGPYAAALLTRIGIFATMTSMGVDHFSIALYENRRLVETILDRYCDWTVQVAERAGKLGFDLFVSMDDMAFKSAPFFSPSVFRDLVLPRYRLIAERLTIPWILHSDGNMMPFIEDLLSLGIAGFHPVEKGAMDIRAMKRDYGKKICLLGNVDLNLLTRSTPQDVKNEVRGLIQDVGPGGGYIVTSGNSLAAYLKPENAIAMSEAVQEYGRYPINC